MISMSKHEVANLIKTVATTNGFKTRDGMNVYGLPEMTSENLHFFVNAKSTKVRLDLGYVEYLHLEFRASLRRMGGEPTVDELFATAREIERGATAVETLNLLDLSYKEPIED